MAVQTGLGEPRGPWFISPELDPDGRGWWDAPERDPGGRRPRRLLAALAVVAISAVWPAGIATRVIRICAFVNRTSVVVFAAAPSGRLSRWNGEEAPAESVFSSTRRKSLAIAPRFSAEWVSSPPRDTRNPPGVVGRLVTTWVREPWWVKRTGDDSLR
jgi:hypothetical protein